MVAVLGVWWLWWGCGGCDGGLFLTLRRCDVGVE